MTIDQPPDMPGREDISATWTTPPQMNSKIVALVDYYANRIFTSRYNPFYYTGQISVFLLLLLLLSGVYLLPFYKINVERAYDSVQYLTVDQWYLGGIMRSIHRYASDALIVTIILHGLRLFLTGKFRFNRWLIWVAGASMFGFILLQGITGYWMVWDERAKLVATSTLEFLDSLPIFPKPLARALIGGESVTNLLFFAVIFFHVGGTLFLVALILLHFSRFSRTKLFPSIEIWSVVLLILLGLSFLKPALSAPPADLTRAPVDVPADWFYLFLLPLANSGYGLYSWLLLALASIAILAPPWTKGLAAHKTARVVKERCVGCELCYADCPYGAIIMVTEGGKPIALVSEERCSGCGTCLGSCNFNAIQYNGLDLEKMKADITRTLASRGEEPLLIGFACEHALDVYEHMDGDGKMRGVAGVEIIPLRCLGMVNPSSVSHALDAGAAGVFLAGCKMGDCNYRLGNRWLKERLEENRAPVLKDKRLDRIRTFWLSPHEKREFRDAVQGFKDEIKAAEMIQQPKREEKERSMTPLALLALLLPALLIGYLSDSPPYSLIESDEALLLFTMSHKGERVEPCIEPTIEELKAGNYTECGRERVPVTVELDIDGMNVLAKTYDPKGLRRDGPSYAYEKIRVTKGKHAIAIKVADSRDGGFDHEFERVVEFEKGRMVVIDFEERRFVL